MHSCKSISIAAIGTVYPLPHAVENCAPTHLHLQCNIQDEASVGSTSPCRVAEGADPRHIPDSLLHTLWPFLFFLFCKLHIPIPGTAFSPLLVTAV